MIQYPGWGTLSEVAAHCRCPEVRSLMERVDDTLVLFVNVQRHFLADQRFEYAWADVRPILVRDRIAGVYDVSPSRTVLPVHALH